MNKQKLQMLENKEIFYQWFVGFVDGDGAFSVTENKRNNTWNLSFSLTQSTYNAKLIFFIKKILGIGGINIEKEKRLITYRCRNRQNIKKIILPIFEKYKLLTSKEYKFLKFKEICNILDSDKSKEQKNNLIQKLVSEMKIIPDSFIPSSFNNLIAFPYTIGYVNTIDYEKIFNNPQLSPQLLQTISDNWLIGFWEAKGSFYISIKEKKEQKILYTHAIGITQKLDRILLEIIKRKFGITSKVLFRKNHNFYDLKTSSSRALNNVISFFKGKLIGAKNQEFSFWSKTRKFHNNSEKMERAQKILQKMRSFRPDPTT